MAARWQGLIKGAAIAVMLAVAVWIVVAGQRGMSGPATWSATPRPHPHLQDTNADDPPPARLGDLIVPVAGISPDDLVDTFADVRSEGRRHDAIDIMAPLGTPVIAAAAGRVEKRFVSKAGGNTVYVRSGDRRLIYYYAHLDRHAPTLVEGAVLRRGSPIGTVGFSGNANPAAPHLHFAIMTTSPGRQWWETAAPINPYPLLTARRVTDRSGRAAPAAR